MKKIFTLLLLVASIGFAQNSGITYQAVIYGPNGQQLPGANNQQYILANKTICLRFSIIDQLGNVEYQETIVTTTDKFGMVNLLIGTGTQVSGYAPNFAGIVWNANTKSLKVELDPSQNCQNFTQISNNPFTYVPFAYYSANPGEPGPPGPVGPAGPAGPQGIQGIAGATGPQGIPGSNGLNGAPGAQGPQGIQGIQGAAGMPGTNGLNGAPGLNGTNGISAYQVAVNNGFVGTEQQWLLSLIGASGTNGLSAYQIAVNNGFVGTESAWLATLIGPQGPAGSSNSSIGSSAVFSNSIIEYQNNSWNPDLMKISKDGKYIIQSKSSSSLYNSSGQQIQSQTGEIRIIKYENGNIFQYGQTIYGTTNEGLGGYIGISNDGQKIYASNNNNEIKIFVFLNGSWNLNQTFNIISLQNVSGIYNDDFLNNLFVVNFQNSQINVYKNNGSNWTNTQISSPILLSGANRLSVNTDGTVFALSVPSFNSGFGKIIMFKLNSNIWQVNGNIDGNSNLNWGQQIDLSDDGTKIAISTYINPLQGSNINAPSFIKTYAFDIASGNWIQYNNTIVVNYIAQNLKKGWSSFIRFSSDSNKLIVVNQVLIYNEFGLNQIVCYNNYNNNWAQLGSNIKLPICTNCTNFESNLVDFNNNVLVYYNKWGDDTLNIKNFN